MDFAPKPGCPMCGIVSTASRTHLNSPRSPTFPSSPAGPEVLWRDDNFTAYREKVHPVSSKGHVIILFNLHVPSMYTLSSSDVPLLVEIRSLAHRLLSSIATPPSPLLPSPLRSSASNTTPTAPLTNSRSQFRIGFIAPPFKDNKIPVTDHLHVHAYITPHDLCGWWRAVAYGPLAWYALDDLIAEIRESTSNNRVKSGYDNRILAPIDMVPNAGARQGTADGVETTESGIATFDVENSGERTPVSNRSRSPASFLLQPPTPTPSGQHLTP
ncbi:hypothetical protein BD410DRAFT_738534 [Rickenella mellea]|uniref:HIT domain-containing protein n=1 Tax=Rickenella mellea TaxID=50990 RepID=A0A4Y7QPI5_9AGAM|nr:hypothetical protein BD410DRAFT_738534 [Rickenella mellea]